jgi:alkylation response protein AidB-like acyl-CoA dehydrogenase
MRFDLSEEQTILKNSARDFCVAEFPVAEVRRMMEADTAYSPQTWTRMAEQGWTGILFPEEYGGQAMGLVETAVILEEMGRTLAASPFISTVLLAGTLLAAAADDAQKRKYLAAICKGESLATLALLEAAPSWDVDAVGAVQAETDGAVLDGKKLFVTDAADASFLLVAARMKGQPAVVLVNPKQGGVSIKKMPAIDGTRPLAEIEFRGAKVQEVLATGAAAQAAIERALDVATVGLVAEMVGGMQWILDTTVQYAKTRRQFGRPIGQFQSVQNHCADMYLMTESSRSAAYYAAWALEVHAPDARLAVSSAKSYASEAYRLVGNSGIQVHGGMGFTWENDLHLYYRRAKLSEVLFGDAAYHRERIARLWIG